MFSSSKARPPAAVEDSAAEIPQIAGAEIAAASYGKRIGGDFYDSFRANPERVLFGLLDVAGRRADNEQVLSSAQKLFRTLGVELFAKPDINESDAMTELCLRLNHEILSAAGGVRSCPAFIGCYHERFGTLCYTNAGHTPGLLLDSASVVDLPATGLPLGLFSHTTCQAPTAGMERGAALLLVSRGVVEGQSQNKKVEEPEFGLERVREHLRTEPHSRAQPLCSSILKAVAVFTGDTSSGNDMTALALVRTG